MKVIVFLIACLATVQAVCNHKNTENVLMVYENGINMSFHQCTSGDDLVHAKINSIGGDKTNNSFVIGISIFDYNNHEFYNVPVSQVADYWVDDNSIYIDIGDIVQIQVNTNYRVAKYTYDIFYYNATVDITAMRDSTQFTFVRINGDNKFQDFVYNLQFFEYRKDLGPLDIDYSSYTYTTNGVNYTFLYPLVENDTITFQPFLRCKEGYCSVRQSTPYCEYEEYSASSSDVVEYNCDCSAEIGFTFGMTVLGLFVVPAIILGVYSWCKKRYETVEKHIQMN